MLGDGEFSELFESHFHRFAVLENIFSAFERTVCLGWDYNSWLLLMSESSSRYFFCEKKLGLDEGIETLGAFFAVM